MKIPRTAEAITIRFRMDVLGLRTADLAKQIGYKPGYVSNVIAGFEKSSKARRKISEALGISIWPQKVAPVRKKGKA